MSQMGLTTMQAKEILSSRPRKNIALRSDHSAAQQAEKLIDGLKMLLGLSELPIEDACCTLKMNGVVINMQIEENEKTIIFSAFLSELPQSADKILLEQLLVGNLYWRAGATIGLEPQSRCLLMLEKYRIRGLTPEELIEELKKFAKNVSEARNHLEAYERKPVHGKRHFS